MKNALITILVAGLGFNAVDNALDKEEQLYLAQKTQEITISSFQRNLTCSTVSNSFMDISALQGRCSKELASRFVEFNTLDIVDMCSLYRNDTASSLSVTFSCLRRIPNKRG
jgi:hypothetical protein